MKLIKDLGTRRYKNKQVRFGKFLCLVCNKKIERIMKNGLKAKTCSHRCVETLQPRTGKNNNSWKGGKWIDADGYVLIYTSEHPRAYHKRYVFEHRLAMEKYLGRYLTKEEVVHHINKIRDDNRIRNLMLFKNKVEHTKYHKQLKETNHVVK